MSISSFETSFIGLFEREAGGPPLVARVEVPLIQRDYAQGRDEPRVRVIRDNFLDVLHASIAGGEPVGLDFVYGEVRDGTLEPLDGQQRLTTLFLLHWYVAARTGRIPSDHGWTRFSYATRPSARLFCERLVNFPIAESSITPSSLITDQAWYLHVWAHDPTIESMLLMLDAIHQRFGSLDLEDAWNRLADPVTPAVSFHLLPITDMGSTEDLYIKMNSRGRPLTEFENFKARFEKVLDGSGRASEFGHRVDGEWADVFWPLRGTDDIVDDEFLRYFEFIIELCEWRRDDATARSQALIRRAQRAFEPGRADASENLEFLFQAFDVWVGVDTRAFFDGLLASSRSGISTDGKVVLFGASGPAHLNMFEACCRDLDTLRFGNPRKLVLYAVLLHLIHGTEDFPRRLRAVRNLVEASVNEIRFDRMPRLVADVGRIVIDGNLDEVQAFNQIQLADEVEKRGFLADHPDQEPFLFGLEDHEILRGSLMAFDLDAESLQHRARAFEDLFSGRAELQSITGALLAMGEYHRTLGTTTYRFGSPAHASQWRELLTGTARANLSRLRSTLGQLLDAVGLSAAPLATTLSRIQQDWLHERDAAGHRDWRYYLVKYPEMREGRSGIYAAPADLGFSLCMLDRQQLNSYYRDPFLLSIARRCKAGTRVKGGVDGSNVDPWFTGYPAVPRWLHLKNSNVQIRCIDTGFLVKPPDEPALLATFEAVCAEHHVALDATGTGVLEVDGTYVDGSRTDAEDRIEVGTTFLQALIGAGL